MISTAEADALIRHHMPRWPSEPVPLPEAGGRVLREPVEADRDQPPFDRVMMDGFALQASALAAGRRRLRVQGTQAAGAPPLRLDDATACIEIMTGAVLPEGCDAVVPVERTRREGGAAVFDDDVAVAAGAFVHPRGSDYRAGQRLIEPGLVLRAPELAVLASVGKASVNVACQPRVAILATGDELVGPGDAVLPHQIRSCNDAAIEAALATMGIGAIDSRRLSDEPAGLGDALAAALETSDLLVLSGGVSMGKFDHLPGLLEELGVAKVLHRVQQRPGKPMWFGVSDGGVPVFGLPGNPVSALVCLHRFVLPAIRAAQGCEVERRPLTLVEPPDSGDWTRFLPVRLERDGRGREVALNTSGDFFGLSGTDGLAEWPPGHRGGPVPFIPWAGS